MMINVWTNPVVIFSIIGDFQHYWSSYVGTIQLSWEIYKDFLFKKSQYLLLK